MSVPLTSTSVGLDHRLFRLARRYAAAAVPGVLVALLILHWPVGDGRHDVAGAAFGHDLTQVWVAGRAARSGHAAAVYDIAAHEAAQIATFGPDAAIFVWHYPPMFLFVARALAALPFPLAVLVWGAVSLGSLAASLWLAARRLDAVLVALAVPAVATCLSYGQNGLVTASLLTAGLVMLDRRPILAGLLLGCLCYKPQLAALAPAILLATGRWRALAGVCATVGALVLASLWAFGVATWVAFAHSLSSTETVILREAWGGASLNASVFGAARFLGGSMAVAWTMQGIAAIVAAGATILVWRSQVDGDLGRAVLLAAIPLVSPYMPVYDLAVWVPAGVFLVLHARRHGDLTGAEIAGIAAVFAVTLDPRGVATATGWPLGCLAAVAVFAIVIDRVRRSLACRDDDAPYPVPLAG